MAVLHGSVQMRRHADGRVEILQAPPTASMSLELLAGADPHLIVVRGTYITLAGQVTYRVTGWDNTQACLQLLRVEGG
jgi:hypothetical protein